MIVVKLILGVVITLGVSIAIFKLIMDLSNVE